MQRAFSLTAHHQPALQITRQGTDGEPVLYIHGATFPIALSVAYPLDGRSWMDDLVARGFDAWGVDFAGYGGSDPAPNLGRATEVLPQIERVADHILAATKRERLSVIAHSWGTIPAGLFASRFPHAINRLVLFGPVAAREAKSQTTGSESTHLVTAEDQWRAFQAGVPHGEPSPIAGAVFDTWAKAYLASDSQSTTCTPHAARVPSGPDHDFADAWSGTFPYDPKDVRAETLVVRGEWDPINTDDDAAWLKRRLRNGRDAKLPRGAHRMHLEQNRQALFDAVGAFLSRG